MRPGKISVISKSPLDGCSAILVGETSVLLITVGVPPGELIKALKASGRAAREIHADFERVKRITKAVRHRQNVNRRGQSADKL